MIFLTIKKLIMFIHTVLYINNYNLLDTSSSSGHLNAMGKLEKKISRNVCEKNKEHLDLDLDRDQQLH